MDSEAKKFYITVGTNIERIRKKHKISAEELANRIGLTKKTIRRYETGEIRINMDRLESVANALNVPIDHLTSENVIPTNEIIVGENVKKIFATNIKKIREQRNLTQEQFGDKIGVAISTVSDWEKAKSLPRAGVIERISTEFNIHESQLFSDAAIFSKLEPMKNTVQVPIIGNISCGNGVLAYEDIEGYEEIPADWVEEGDFFLRVVGDSMTGIRIMHDDLVLIRKQCDVDNGEVAAVCIEDEIVLKRVFKKNGMFILQSENPNYEPIVCTGYDNAQIIGKLKKLIVNF
ncbi:helix-turn-helix domain-containing protein [Bacillus thuringiensis]|nr:helix-turn-helix domain-containing protein [Bacillus thuringiensis]